MNIPTSIKVLFVILLITAFWQPNANAGPLILGTQPWCMTDGDSYDCYYYTPAGCAAIVPQYGGNRWCERNPEVYRIGRRYDSRFESDYEWRRRSWDWDD